MVSYQIPVNVVSLTDGWILRKFFPILCDFDGSPDWNVVPFGLKSNGARRNFRGSTESVKLLLRAGLDGDLMFFFGDVPGGHDREVVSKVFP